MLGLAVSLPTCPWAPTKLLVPKLLASSSVCEMVPGSSLLLLRPGLAPSFILVGEKGESWVEPKAFWTSTSPTDRSSVTPVKEVSFPQDLTWFHSRHRDLGKEPSSSLASLLISSWDQIWATQSSSRYQRHRMRLVSALEQTAGSLSSPAWWGLPPISFLSLLIWG